MDSTSQAEAFGKLTPDELLDAVEATGVRCDGRFLALNSYENRVYQIGVEDQPPLVAKFYRPERWINDAIIEEHKFTANLAAQEIPVIPPQCRSSGQYTQVPWRFQIRTIPVLRGSGSGVGQLGPTRTNGPFDRPDSRQFSG